MAAKAISMGRRRFGPLASTVPVIGQGTWEMGSGTHHAAELEALRIGIELGLTHIDTAEMYGDGRAEELVGEAIVASGRRREDLFIVSKVLPHHATFAGTIAACEASLKRLRMEYLDVFLLHWRGRHPLAETMAAMESLVRAGKIRALGVSNFAEADLEEARAALTTERLACNQVLYHLGQRYIDAGMVDYCAIHDIALVGYSPFGHGDFPSPESRGGQVLAEIAQQYEATPHQVALAFLIRKPPLFTIPKAADAAHVRDNAGALRLSLDPEDLRRLDVVFPYRVEGGLPMI
jgi:diketogulonate reductase-like aldo/keto reductase